MSGLMKPISQLRLGFSDAENYRRSENKNLFAQVFVRNQMLEQVFDPSISFVVGEKGTGKTAYAVYISNTTYREHRAAIKYIRETEYQKFVAMKRERHLGLSDYVSIWKTIICLMLAQKIRAERQVSLLTRLTTFPQLIRAIDEYYAGAFSPEIVHAIQFVESSGLAATLLSKHAQAEVTHQQTETFSEARFQTNLLYIQKRLEDALRSLKLPRSQLLFVDGIDIRPSSIPYEDYLECIKGLAGAVWELNNDFFPSIKDSPGRMRTVLLIRPDIFQFLGLQNQNTKIRDNSVLLDWRTTYVDHRSSSLFEVSDTLLGVQQEQHCELGEAWDHYFPFDSRNVVETFNTPSSFVGFLRLSLHRPRDIVTMLGILQEIIPNYSIPNSSTPQKRYFSQRDVESANFRNKYAEYLLGEIKDHLLFYYTSEEYEIFLEFFEFLQGRAKFDYSQYMDAFEALSAHLESLKRSSPQFMNTPNNFLQFLYDLNVICYIQEPSDDRERPFIRWCFRERNYSNISPKVRTHTRYEIHYGLVRALNLGKSLKGSRSV